MTLLAAIHLLLALGAEEGPADRLLLCRPVVQGEPALAKADALASAGRALAPRFLDYGVPCEGEAEAARATARAGLALAVSSLAEGRTAGSRFQLVLTSAADERAMARRVVEVAPGGDAVPPLKSALEELLDAAPRAGRERVGPWITLGAGVALLAAGAVSALVARSSAGARDRAADRGDWRGYVNEDASWRRWRAGSGIALGAGAAAVGAGLAWKLAF
jgi:hypothetical protein